MKIVLGIDSIRYPLTGIGIYTYQLCKRYLLNPEIELQGISKFSLLNHDKVVRLIDQIGIEAASEESTMPKSSWDSKKHILRQMIRSVPLSQLAYQTVSSYRSVTNLSQFGGDVVYHSPNFIAHQASCKKVITVHDLSHLAFPQFHPKDRVRYLQSRLATSIAEADHIIVDTNFTRNSLLDLGLVQYAESEKISTIRLGVDESFVPINGTKKQPTLEKFKLRYKGFILSIGTLEPRKNLVRLIQAYQSLPASIATEYPLVIGGSKGWKYDSILEAVNNTKTPHRVVLLGYLPENQMIDVLSSAKCFVYPSLYEGFGLPVLEAMKCDVPVVTSNEGALKEVAGNGAMLCNSTDVESIAHSLRQVLESDSVSQDLVARGREQASKFSWEKCAQETLNVYKKIMEN